MKQQEGFTIDFEGFNQRIIALPLPTGNYSNLQTGSAGEIYYLESSGGLTAFGADGKTSLHRYDLNKRKDETILPEVNDYEVTADHKKIGYVSKGAWSIAPSAGKD